MLILEASDGKNVTSVTENKATKKIVVKIQFGSQCKKYTGYYCKETDELIVHGKIFNLKLIQRKTKLRCLLQQLLYEVKRFNPTKVQIGNSVRHHYMIALEMNANLIADPSATLKNAIMFNGNDYYTPSIDMLLEPGTQWDWMFDEEYPFSIVLPYNGSMVLNDIVRDICKRIELRVEVSDGFRI